MNSVTTKRPWGSFVTLTKNQISTVKLLYVNQGEELSLQYHNHREEFWRVIEGHPRIVIGDKVHDSKPEDEFNIQTNVNHRISAPNDSVVILEVSFGDFDEDDIVRLEDKYNRVQ